MPALGPTGGGDLITTRLKRSYGMFPFGLTIGATRYPFLLLKRALGFSSPTYHTSTINLLRATDAYTPDQITGATFELDETTNELVLTVFDEEGENGVAHRMGAAGALVHKRATFTEVTGDGTITATLPLPAGAVIHHAQFTSHTNWTAATSAALSFGYTGALTTFINALNIKTTSPVTAGPYGAQQYFAVATDLVASVTKVGTGTAGRDTLDVWYSVPVITVAA